MEVISQLAEYEKKEQELTHANRVKELDLQTEFETKELAARAEISARKRAENEAAKQAEADLQILLDQIQEAELERLKKKDTAKIETEKELVEIDKAKQKAYADTVTAIMTSISPDLTAALNAQANSEIMNGIGQAVAPYAIAKNESVAEAVSTLLRGTSLEDTLKNIGSLTL